MTEITLHNIEKRFGSKRVLRRASATFSEGNVYGIKGSNGSGKSTLFNVISGTVRPEAGEVSLRGKSLNSLSTAERAGLGIGYCRQKLEVFPRLDLLSNLMIGGVGASSWSELWKTFGLLGEARKERKRAAANYLRHCRLLDKSHSWAQELSYGEQRLVSLGQVYLGGFQVVLLDEVFSGIAPLLQPTLEALVRSLAEEGRTVLLVDHDASRLGQLADRLLTLDQGRLIEEGA